MEKNRYLLVLACYCICLWLIPSLSPAQQPKSGRHAMASPEQMDARATYIPKYNIQEPTWNGVQRKANPWSPLPKPGGPITGKVAAVNPIQLGTAFNIYTCVTTEQNQVVAVDSLDLVAFIHRNDPNIYGGSGGHLRYDISIDGGNTWSNDIGPLNPIMTWQARYPNITIGNWLHTDNPLATQLAYYAPTLNTAGTAFDGHVYGIGDIATSGTPVVTENYKFQGQNTHLPGGFCIADDGTYWITELEGNGSVPVGDVFVYKGVYNATLDDIEYFRDTIVSPNYLGYDGSPRLIGSNIAFAPDGSTGWVVWLGDLIGGPDSTYLPIVSKTTDCGQTWSSPMEININNVPWMKDTLQSLWTDSLGNPAATGRASCAFDFDLTVDVNGNPHISVVIGSGIDYSFSSGYAKFLGDITTPDGGVTWDVDYISPVLTFRTTTFGGGITVSMDNHPQVARDRGGCNIFFSWADSDTATTACNQNGVGFGEIINLSPNLRIAAKNVTTGNKTYPKLVTDDDLLWNGTIMFPTMAPVVLTDANGWKLPIVTAVMGGNDPVNAATFWYFGNDATIPNDAFCTPASMSLYWDTFCSFSFVSPCSTQATACPAPVLGPCALVDVKAPKPAGITLQDAYPNPSHSAAMIGFELPEATTLTLTVYNSLGQHIATLAHGTLEAGLHQARLETQDLPAGIYHYQLRTETGAIHKKLLVTH